MAVDNSTRKPSFKNPLSPWMIDISNFYSKENTLEKIKFLLSFAILAPSSHNSQPWSFSIEKNVIKVFLNPKRILPIADADDRQSYISLGCAIENIIIAADYYGYSTKVSTDNSVTSITLDFNSISIKNDDHLIFSIPKRMVNRGEYFDRTITAELIKSIVDLQNENLSIKIISDDNTKAVLSDIALNATSASMANNNFREELSKYVISNISNKKIGMPGKGLGFPTPISIVAPFLLKKLNLSKLSNKQDSKILKHHTPHFFIISTKDDNKVSWISAGRIAQRIFLILTKNGVSTALWGAPIEVNNYYKEIQNVLNIDLRPQLFFRVGYPKKNMGNHSPRLSVDEILL